MWQTLYPIIIIVISNIFYNVCTKEIPENTNSFAVLTVTYLIAAAVSFAVFAVSSKGKGLLPGFSGINWASLVLGIVIIGLEAGYILAYRNGWEMSRASVTANITLAVALLAVAFIFYHEKITARKIAGILLCSGGLLLINI